MMTKNRSRTADQKHLDAMRKLGVRWRKGGLPHYPHTMSQADMMKADDHYDGMSTEFVHRMQDKKDEG